MSEKDNISRSSIFRDKMRVEREKRLESQTSTGRQSEKKRIEHKYRERTRRINFICIRSRKKSVNSM